MDGNFDGVAASVVWLPVTEIGMYIYIYIYREKTTSRPQKVAQVAIFRRSEHHAVFIRCQHQLCLYYSLGQSTGATPSLMRA